MPDAQKTWDYVLVGSGVAAVTLAKNLLAHDPRASILMLEAGPFIPSKQRRAWWDYVTLSRTPYEHTYDVEGVDVVNVTDPFERQQVDWLSAGTRVKAVGGSTMHWGAWSLRLKPEDFHLRTNTGEGADWPITYADLERHYAKAEEFLSVCGDDEESWNRDGARSSPYPMPPFAWTEADGSMLEAFERLGIEPGKMPLARYRKCMTTGTCKYCPFGARFSAVDVLMELLDDKQRHPNLELRDLVVARRVVTREGDRSVVEAIECVDARTGGVERVRARTFVVCAGAYETPKLLMASKSEGWPNGVGNDHDLLGRFLISHSMLKVRGRTPSNPHRLFQEYDFPTLMSRSYDTPERQKIGKIFLFKNRTLPNVDIARLMIEGKTPEQVEAIVSGPMETEIQAFMEEKGRWDNRLTLAEGHDRFGLPRTAVRFVRTPEDKANAQVNLDLMRKIIVEMGYEVVYAKTENPGAHHTTGTCRMGRTPEEGVTDEHLRVHGVENLYLCSNGVFPTGSAVNPTLTLTALAIRLSERLAGQVSVPVLEPAPIATPVENRP